MRTVDIIQKKRDGLPLSDEEIHFLINGYVKGDIPDYQISAFLMAVCFQGMDKRETATLTLAMMHSGDIVDLSEIPGVKVDKHSTGGVGDTTTLVIAPLVAACGGVVAKMSGRGLGHTGGTLDKLESIPGVCVEQSREEFIDIVKRHGLAVVGQSGNLVPADKKLYALRDVTATVKSLPLIASSIMSKKLAAGADAIVLDVKVGTGAFMSTVNEARELAQTMVELGHGLNRRVMAIITDMNQPLGMNVGNALEVKEAVELLSGKLPETDPLYEVCMLLASQMLLLGDVVKSKEQAAALLTQAIRSGAGLKKLQEMIAAQGGDASYLCVERIDELCRVTKHIDVPAKQSGYIREMNASCIGLTAQMLGAGRAEKSDPIDPAVGLVMHKRLMDTRLNNKDTTKARLL
ncbi:MAG: pyrimidine-nucleoside phosphorylase [Eubacteriales bacterium]|nr:pyrimidine-nucleoside phosphorylase [Eubacteriales bacterium]